MRQWHRDTKPLDAHDVCGPGMTYDQMNNLAQQAPAGCDGLLVLPYGNGAERTLENRAIQLPYTALIFRCIPRAICSGPRKKALFSLCVRS